MHPWTYYIGECSGTPRFNNFLASGASKEYLRTQKNKISDDEFISLLKMIKVYQDDTALKEALKTVDQKYRLRDSFRYEKEK